MASRLKIVLAFQPGPGHASRTTAVAAVLRQRGHHITLASAASYRSRLHSIPHDAFVPIGPDWIEDEVVLPLKPEDFQQELRDRSHAILEMFLGGARLVADDLLKAFEGNGRPDCFVFDYTLFGGPPAAQSLGVPWAVIFGVTVPMRYRGWPPYGSSKLYKSSLVKELGYALAERYAEWENRDLNEPLLQIWRLLGKPIGSVWEPYERWAKLGLVGSIPECEFPKRPGIPRNCHYVGPLFDGDEQFQTPAPLEQFIDRSNTPMIHVTLGLTFSRAAAVLHEIMRAFVSMPWRVIVATGRLEFPSVVDGNTFVADTVPHLRIFPRLSAVVCHGGANTLMKALYFGVPALIIPLGAEQRSNASRFEYAGIAKVMLPDEIDAARIREAVEMLIDPSNMYIDRARGLAKSARVRKSTQRAAELIEQIVEA